MLGSVVIGTAGSGARRRAGRDPRRGTRARTTARSKWEQDIDVAFGDEPATVVTAHHPAGTCAMGTLPGTVLDPELRVHGVARLRVVDASAMPDMVSAHINACVLMMAEKAADLIRGREPLPAAKDA